MGWAGSNFVKQSSGRKPAQDADTNCPCWKGTTFINSANDWIRVRIQAFLSAAGCQEICLFSWWEMLLSWRVALNHISHKTVLASQRDVPSLHFFTHWGPRRRGWVLKNKQRDGTIVGVKLDHPNLKYETVWASILDSGFLVMMLKSGCCYASKMCFYFLVNKAFLCP